MQTRIFDYIIQKYIPLVALFLPETSEINNKNFMFTIYKNLSSLVILRR